MRWLFLIFVLVPILEIWLLIKAGGLFGAGWVILSVVATAIIGTYFLKLQGAATLMQAQSRLLSGQIPKTEIVEGLLLFIAGAFLLTPGYFTDLLGFSVLLPATRKKYAEFLVNSSFVRSNIARTSGFQQTGFESRTKQQPNNMRQNRHHGTHIIEGEFTREDDDKTKQ